MGNILVTGALGQIGSELVLALVARYGADRVIASDIRMPQKYGNLQASHQEQLDCCDVQQIQEVVRRHNIDTIYHLAALLSAIAEEKPQVAWKINMDSLYNVLEVTRQYQCALFFPSSIGAFGPSTPPNQTPQVTIQRPNTMYGVTKVAGELLCDYYASRFDVDTRDIRLPGLISSGAPPGGGTTDYAVEMFYQAVRYQHYTCFLGCDTALEMMYIPDAVRAMIELMEADAAALTHRNAYNVTAMSFTPQQLAEAAYPVAVPIFSGKNNTRIGTLAAVWDFSGKQAQARQILVTSAFLPMVFLGSLIAVQRWVILRFNSN